MTDNSKKTSTEPEDKPIVSEDPLEIKFKLNNRQFEVLQELLKLPVNTGHTPSEACRLIVVQSLITAKQQMVIGELTQDEPATNKGGAP